MPYILDNIIRAFKKLKKTNNNCNHCDKNNDIENTEKNMAEKDIKEEIGKLIKNNEKYFLSEIIASTRDVIIHGGLDYIEYLKMSGYRLMTSAEAFEKYGVFMYINDLYNCVYAPEQVKRELGRLVHEYGIEKITEEVALYMKENYPEKFGISIVCSV